MVVAIPSQESELDSLPPEVLKGRLAGARRLYYHGATGVGDRFDDGGKWLAVACVLCMLLEIAALLAFRT